MVGTNEGLRPLFVNLQANYGQVRGEMEYPYPWQRSNLDDIWTSCAGFLQTDFYTVLKIRHWQKNKEKMNEFTLNWICIIKEALHTNERIKLALVVLKIQKPLENDKSALLILLPTI